MKRTRSATPAWVREVVDAESEGKEITVYWYSFKPGYYGHGRGSPWHNWIKCYADDNKTNASLCLVLHEITHVLVPPGNIKNRQRWAWHGPEYIKRVIALYEKYGVLEYAAKWERYKRIKNAINRRLLQMNRYKKAAPSAEKDGTYQMITCPVCGFKDATSDVAGWTCMECEDKVTAAKRVVADVKKAIASPLVSPELKQALKDHVPALELKINEKDALMDAHYEKEENGMLGALADLQKSLGIEPRKPPTPPAPETVREFKVGGLQCKIVSTKRN